MKEYMIIEEDSTVKLQEEVNVYIKEGWQPLGGVCAIYGKYDNSDMPDKSGNAACFYLQAMAK